MRVGIVFALATMLFGFGLGGVFGLAEDSLKGDLDRRGQAVLESVYAGNEAMRIETKDKAWAYYKRAHLHAGAMGTSALAMSMLLAGLPGATRLRSSIAAALGIGGLGYGLFWLLAGMRAPGLGSTGLAKESLKWLSMPSAGLFLIGTILVTVLFAKAAWARSSGA
ncbi:MAG: hypothetical protein KJZ54_08095 [Phycisphaerales bacterium]|nr:hypothetical protein [Phycisphaerales bacterium]